MPKASFQSQAPNHRFYGGNPGLTAEKRRVGTVMASWALRGRGSGGGRGGNRSMSHNNNGRYPQNPRMNVSTEATKLQILQHLMGTIAENICSQ